uniref:Uncharacterized protein n=1 Tax=Lepeophtheirus salmonis TaxID=72036 RepID=A0A0K2U8I2_LEPSM
MHLFSNERHFLFLRVLILVLPLRSEFKANTANRGLVASTASMGFTPFRWVRRVHFIAAFADILAFAQVVDVRHPFPRLSLALHHNLLDFGMCGRDQEFGAVETHASKHFYGFRQKSGMKHGLGQLQMPKMSRTLRHGSSTGLTSGTAVDYSLMGIHQTPQFGSPTLISLRKTDSSLRYTHTTNLFRTQNTKLNPLHEFHWGLRVPSYDRRHFDLISSYSNY